MHFIQAKSIVTQKNKSLGMNLCRGCTHGCIYCDSRSLCYGMDHPFEDIAVKENALVLLEEVLRKRRKKCMIGTGSMSDPYIPEEETLGLMRGVLELIDQYGFGATLITKSARVLRDIELIKRINRKTKAVVQMTLTTFDEDLCRIIEPNVSTTKERFEALCALRDAGIPTVVWLTPLLPFINDTEENLRGILEYCIRAGVRGIVCFGMGLTLRDGNRQYFYKKLDRHFPGLREKYERTFGTAYDIPSPNASRLWKIFQETCHKHGIETRADEIFSYLYTFPEAEDIQLSFL